MAGSTEQSTWTLALRDETSTPAHDAAAALERLRATIEKDTKALRAMQAAMSRMKAGGQASSHAFAELRARAAALRTAIARNEASFVELGGSFAAVEGRNPLEELIKAARGLPGPLGSIASRLGGLESLLGAGALAAGASALAAAFLAIVAASAALVGAVAAATASLLRYGIAQADARRSELLHLEVLTRMRTWYKLAAGSATELQAAIDRVSDASSLGRAEVSGYAEQLYRAGLRGQAFEDALDAVSTAGAAGGDRLARRFQGMAVAAARTGGSVRALADTVRARFGDIADRQALGLDRQLERLRENIARLFSGLEIEGFLRALRQVTSFFSQSTASGRALRRIVEVLFQPMIDGVSRTAPIVRRFFYGMLFAGQRLTIAFLRLRNRVIAAFGGSDVLSSITAQTAALQAGELVVNGFVSAVIVAIAVLGTLAATMAGIAAITYAFLHPLETAHLVFAHATSLWERAGKSLTDGLVAGLERGRARVLEVIRGMADASTQALRDALQIRSPSRVFASLGEQIPAGLAEGIEGASSVSDAAAAAAVTPTAPAGRASAPGMVASFGDIHVHMGPQDSPRDAAGEIVDEIMRLLQGAGVEIGAAS